jgi:hypothetical protein
MVLIATQAVAGPKKHKKAQKLPIQLGTSGGNATDFAADSEIDLPCLSGTLGALIQGDVQYILSTNLTLAKRNNAKNGDPVIQPGLIDTAGGACNPENPKGHPVADLSKFKKIKFHKVNKTPKNQVDAALAEVRDDAVDPNGRVLEIGMPGSHTVAPFLGQQVQKSGRGTGVKAGTVVATNITGDVDYGFPAGSGPLARMIKQFVVQSNNSKPIMSFGDSGTVFFEDLPSCPGLVGLGIAVNLVDPTFALVTPMSTVLKQLGKVKPKDDLEPVGCKGGVVAPEPLLSTRMRAAIRDAERIQRRVEDAVLELDGVTGIGIGVATDNPEEVVFKILVSDDSAAIRESIPSELGKLRTEILRTGRFGAM